MNDLNLSHLKYFVDAALNGSISASARKNFVTQSAVSRAISALESVLGVDLVLHGKNHFQLTEAGEAVVARSPSVFEAATHLKETATEHVGVLRGPLRFGCNQAVASRLISPALVELEKLHPEIKPDVKLGNIDQIQELLKNGETDFGIIVDDGELEGAYTFQKIYSDKLIVVKSPKLKGRPFESLIVSRTQKGGLSQKYFREYKKAYGETPRPKIVLPSWQVILDMAIAGYGAALVPRFLCEDALDSKKLELVSTKVAAVTFDLCAVVNRNRNFPRNALVLFEILAGPG